MGKSWRSYENGVRTMFNRFSAAMCIEELVQRITSLIEEEGISDWIVISDAECFVIYDDGFVQQLKLVEEIKLKRFSAKYAIALEEDDA
jgi:hypothetical protein